MNPSEFKHRISFFDSVESEDDDGFVTMQKVEVSKAWAMIKTLQGREYQAANTTKNENTIRFVVRYHAGKNVNEDMSIQYRGKEYQIETILHDDLSMKTITIVAKEKCDYFMMQLTGMDALLRQLEGMSNIESVKDEALEAGAEHMRQKIEKNTPVSALQKEHAKDHIIKEKTENGYNIGPSKDHFYLQFKEFGTKNMPAEPFIQPTFDREIGESQKIMIDKVKQRLGL